MSDMSSDSEDFDHPSPLRRTSRRLPTPPSSPRSPVLSDSILNRDSVNTLTSTLHLRENLARSSDRLREERLRRGVLRDSRPLRSSDLEEEAPGRRFAATSPLRDYGDAGDYSRRRRRKKTTVRFDSEPEELHDIHQTIRDLSSDQLRLGEDLEREIDRRKWLEYDHRRAITDITDSMHRSRAPEESVSSRVERRLKEIEDEMRSQRGPREIREPAQSSGMIAAEIRQALRSQTLDEDRQMRDKLMKSENDRQQILSDYEVTKRKLDQSEGTRNALKFQIDELQDQLSRSDHDKARMKDQLAEYTSVLEEEGLPLSRQARRERKLQDERHKQEVEKQKLEREIESLKSQLTRSSGIRELEGIRKELEKSERQRTQLSDHMEALNRDIDSKEKYQAKLINQLKDTTDKYEESDRQRQLAMAQLEDTQKRLREINREADMLADKVRDTQRLCEDAERKRDEMKVKAQEIVRQWKQKCKKLEKDVDRYKHSAEQLMGRNEKLARDNEMNKTSSQTNVQRMESLHRELNDALAIRAQQDEQLRLKEIELNEMKSFKMDLEKELRDTRAFMDKLDNELQTQIARQASLKEEKLRTDEELLSVKSSFQQAQDQVHHFQADLKEVGFEKAQLSARLAEESAARQELQSKVTEAQQREEAAREESAQLIKELKQAHELHTTSMSQLQRELQEVKAREDQSVQEVAMKMKKENAELEAEMQTLKMQRADDKCTMKQLRRQAEKMKAELEKVGEDLAKIQDENSRVRKKYERLKQGFEENMQRAEDGDARLAELELTLQQTQDTLRRHQAECEGTLHSIGSEIDLLVQLTSSDAPQRFRVLTPPIKGIYTDTQKWLADKRSKLQWLQGELRTRHQSERMLKQELNRSRTDVHETVRASDNDREFYESELQRQEEMLEEVNAQRKVLQETNKEKAEKVMVLEDQISRLTQQIETRARALERSLDSIPDNDTTAIPEIQRDFQQLQELQRERESINERYNKYKETIGVLQQQLQDAKKTAEDRRQARLDASLQAARVSGWSPPSPKIRRRVQIRDSPPTVIRPTCVQKPVHSSPASPDTRYDSKVLSMSSLDASPVNWSYSRNRVGLTGTGRSSPDPLSLSDNEFKQRFLPPMPSFSSEPERELIS
ncbi:centrosomal protein of 128 kDa-like isoform X2 [Ptychodera flava]|uniref:centrosomal protein of 128 kDa-like isoform X2 n=1 Tax=Ptychodera flava TaxID=63121 RepID=UPI00396A28C5